VKVSGSPSTPTQATATSNPTNVINLHIRINIARSAPSAEAQ
jgi:hypothetical protein